MTPHRFAAPVLALVVSAVLAATPFAAVGGPKDKGPAADAKTGLFPLDAKPSYPYVAMAVPKEYTPDKPCPLLYLMPPISDNAETSKPDSWVSHWSTALLKRGWIVASPAAPFYDNETSIPPLQATLKKITSAYRIDERRIVIAGAYSGANMAWRLVVKDPARWAAVVVVGGEVFQPDRAPLKVFADKPAYIFRGEKDKNYSADMWKADEAAIKFAKIRYTYEEGKGMGNEFPIGSLPTMAAWLDDVWPGTYRERAAAVETATGAKDLVAGFAALKALKDELKKSPYPAFEAKAAEVEKALLDLARAPIVGAKKLLEIDPVGALAEMEAAAKSFKGIKDMEKEAAAELAAMRKDPKVVAAIKARDAEESAKKLLPKAEEAEAKGNLPLAIELFRKIVALGETSLRKDCEAKVAELEAKAGGK
jgi:dienelactone hydrolase